MNHWTSFLLGLLGGIHCAGMCGPLLLALPLRPASPSSFAASRLVYQLGRVAAYISLGAAFGLLGQCLSLAGLQRGVSLAAGTAILLGTFASRTLTLGLPILRGVALLKTAIGPTLHSRTLASSALLGLTNGLLPCGLVYAAAAAAAASGSATGGATTMGFFGLGTLPVMTAIAFSEKSLPQGLRRRLHRVFPATVILLGVLLVLRGLALGIPWISPEIGAQGHGCH